MIRTWIVLAMAAAAALPAAAPVPATQSASAPSVRPKRSLDDYRLIVDRNIFSRDRTRRTYGAARSNAVPAAVQAAPRQRHLVLTGVALQGVAPMAFFEDSLDGQTLWVQLGTPIAHGVLAEISLDSVTYRSSAGDRAIAIGEDIEGIPVTLPAATTQSASAPAGAAAELPASSGSDNDVLQRMRLRRLQELK
ncbi:MAG: hypothetical protein LLG01_15070 [Planctomycetaceae bacterium]|nr:hypothetical protein [Planctomycetaceae bacterium]